MGIIVNNIDTKGAPVKMEPQAKKVEAPKLVPVVAAPTTVTAEAGAPLKAGEIFGMMKTYLD